jgi:hypothetical protein
VVIQFVCANASHGSTRRSGFLVWHHGTCGYCADDGIVGPHAWIDASETLPQSSDIPDMGGHPPPRRWMNAADLRPTQNYDDDTQAAQFVGRVL